MVKHLDRNLQDSFEYTGLWWLPSDPENNIGGTLSYSPGEGVHLDLLGAFRDILDERSNIDVINGVTSNGIVCTLFDNSEVGSDSGWPGFHRQRLRTGLLAMGCELTAIDQLVFYKCRVSYEHLEEWVPAKLFDTDYNFVDGQYRRLTVSAEPKEWFNEQIPAIDGRLRITSNLKSGQKSAGQFSFSFQIFIDIEPDSAQPFQQYRRWLSEIQRLLSLFFAESTYPRKIHGRFEPDDLQNQRGQKVASIFYHLPSFRAPRSIAQIDMLLTFEHLTGHLSDAFQNWLLAEHGVRQAIFLFFSLADIDDADLETKFVNQVHALESFQRSTGQGQYMSREEYDPFFRKMIDAIPESIRNGHRDAIVSRLRYGFEYSQRKRLQELFDSLDPETQDLVTNDVPKFIDDTVNTRNYFVHRDGSLVAKALEWPDLAYVYYRLRILITILLLKYIGLDESTIRERVSKNRRLTQFIGALDEEE